MPLYKKMYFTLFNAITDALQKLDEHDSLQAQETLKRAQQQSEEMYMKAGERTEH